MLSFEFASKSKKLAINDKIKLVLPAWTLTGSAAPTTSAGCGTTTFTATVGNTGTAEANIVFTATSAALLAGSSCTLTWPTGATTPASAQTADTSAYTYELILAGGTIAAAPNSEVNCNHCSSWAALHLSDVRNDATILPHIRHSRVCLRQRR